MGDAQDKIRIDELTRRLAEATGESEDAAKEFVHTLFETIGETLITEERVPIYQFGTFKKSHIDEREGRNPNTGEEIVIPAHYRVYFSPSEGLAEAVNEKYNHLEAYDIPDEVPPPDAMTAGAPETTTTSETQMEQVEETVEPQKEPVPEHVENTEMEALIGPEKDGKKSSNRKKALIAVIIAAVVAVGLGIFMLSRFVFSDKEPVIAAAEESVDTEPDAAEETPVEEPIEEPVEEPAMGEPADNRTLVEEHTVRRGETFVALAGEYWGNKYYWPVMYLDNRGEYPDPDVIYPGQEVGLYSSPFKGPEPEEGEMEYLLDAYVKVYDVYRDLGEELIQRGQRQNTPYLRRYGYWRLMEARTVIYTATRFRPDFIEEVKDRLRGDDYAILTRHFEYYGPFTGN